MKKLVDGKLVDLTQEEINNRLLEEEAWANREKPILLGMELSKKLRSLFKRRTITEREVLLSPISNYLNIIEHDEEITRAEYDEIKNKLISGIGDKLTIEEISQVEATLDAFVLDYRI
jgi:hypothetical protein